MDESRIGIMGRNIRFKKKAKVIDIVITAVSAMLSVGVMLYGVGHFGLKETWVELILNLFYLACLVMMWMFFFNRLKPNHFNYWCTLCVGMTILIRDILIPAEFNSEVLRMSSLILSELLLLMLTFFYARRQWKSYSKRDLWMIFVIDMIIAAIYHYEFYFLEPITETTDYLFTEIWIRPTITYGLVACYVTETDEQ